MSNPIETNNDECIRVVVRSRAVEKEIENQVIGIDTKRGQVSIKKPGNQEEAKEFTFDAVYGPETKQHDIYEQTFRPLVESVLSGFNGTIFAYGQTGTGKTFTMEGVRTSKELQGVIPNSFDHIFTHISRSNDEQYLVRASYLEIYEDGIRDLLAKDQTQRLELKERPDHEVFVKDLSSFVTKDVKEIEHVMNVGNQNRSVGVTNLAGHNARSHTVFIITIESKQIGAYEKSHVRVGKLYMVDLAGSDCMSNSLENVIAALEDEKNTQIPYQDSKLTHLLQESFGGNSKAVMVATISSASCDYEETLATLTFANRVKKIKNKPKMNDDTKDPLLLQYQDEICRLKALKEQGGSGDHVCLNMDDDEVQVSKEKENKEILQTKIDAMEAKLLVGGKNIIGHTDAQEAVRVE